MDKSNALTGKPTRHTHSAIFEDEGWRNNAVLESDFGEGPINLVS